MLPRYAIRELWSKSSRVPFFGRSLTRSLPRSSIVDILKPSLGSTMVLHIRGMMTKGVALSGTTLWAQRRSMAALERPLSREVSASTTSKAISPVSSFLKSG